MKQMGRKIELACLYLLLLMLIQLETTCLAEGYNNIGKSGRFKSFSNSEVKPVKSQGGFKRDGDGDEDEDKVFGAEKRKVYTGPNPLHNR